MRGLDGYSHIWLIFQFHQTVAQGWHPTVRPPRLGGNQRLGVFATRSTFRPNAMGLSAVKLERVEAEAGNVRLWVSGIDLLDGTPILDIKPYIPFADCLPTATASWVPEAPPALAVELPAPLAQNLAPTLLQLIRETLAHDPRPAYQDCDEREYGVVLSGHNVRFRVADGRAMVIAVAPITPASAPPQQFVQD